MENSDLAAQLSACADETETHIDDLRSMLNDMRILASRLMTAVPFDGRQRHEAEGELSAIVDANRRLDDVGIAQPIIDLQALLTRAENS